MATRNVHFVDEPGPGTPVEDVYADNLPEGGGGEPYVLPAATTSTLGGVKMAAHVADATGSEDAHTQLNALIAALEAAGIVSTS